jgi:hypothetical protein
VSRRVSRPSVRSWPPDAQAMCRVQCQMDRQQRAANAEHSGACGRIKTRRKKSKNAQKARQRKTEMEQKQAASGPSLHGQRAPEGQRVHRPHGSCLRQSASDRSVEANRYTSQPSSFEEEGWKRGRNARTPAHVYRGALSPRDQQVRPLF